MIDLSIFFPFDVDNQPPSVTCPQNIQVNADKGVQTATVSWPAPTATDNSGSNVAVFQTMQSPSTLQAGTYTINVMAYDPSGQSSSCSFTIKVIGRSRLLEYPGHSEDKVTVSSC